MLKNQVKPQEHAVEFVWAIQWAKLIFKRVSGVLQLLNELKIAMQITA